MTDIKFRAPKAADAQKISALVAACPPLDRNSVYSTLLLCTDFAETCVVAEQDGEIVGWVSGYIPPNQADTLFVWQVAVDEAARGCGLGRSMIAYLISLHGCDVSCLRTTVTKSNKASRGMFYRLAVQLGANVDEEIWFEQETHFGGAQESEWMIKIHPVTQERATALLAA